MGVHGANRLGANSLLDLVVFGRQAADTTAELVKPNSPPVQLPPNAGEESIARLEWARTAKGPIPTAHLRAELQVMMQKYVPVYRNADDMAKGKEEIMKVMKKYKDIGISDCTLVWNTNDACSGEPEGVAWCTRARKLPGSGRQGMDEAHTDIPHSKAC